MSKIAQALMRRESPQRGLGTVRQPGIPDYVEIGDHSYGYDLSFHRWVDEKIKIGKYCSISQNVKFLAGGNHRTDAVSTFPFDWMMHGKQAATVDDRSYSPTGDIVVGNDVWIGYGASLVGGMTVGHGAVIASHAVVFTSIPPYAIAVGNPAKITKFRFDVETVAALLRIAWWDWDEELVRARVNSFYNDVEDFIDAFDPMARSLS